MKNKGVDFFMMGEEGKKQYPPPPMGELEGEADLSSVDATGHSSWSIAA